MLLQLPGVLDSDEVARVRGLIDSGDWVDGNVTSGPQSALAKRNMQLTEGSPQAREAGDIEIVRGSSVPNSYVAVCDNPGSRSISFKKKYCGGIGAGERVLVLRAAEPG